MKKMAASRKRTLSLDEVLGEICASSGSDNVDNDVSSSECSGENDSDEWTPQRDRQRGIFHRIANRSNSESDSDSSNDVSMQLPGDSSASNVSDRSTNRDIDPINSRDDDSSSDSDNQGQVNANIFQGQRRGRPRGRGCRGMAGRGAAAAKPALRWYNRDNVPVIHPFIGTPGVNIPLTPQSEILDFYRAFISDDIVRETNKYAAANPTPLLPTLLQKDMI